MFSDGGDYRILPKTVDEIKLLTETSHTLAFDILFAHLKRNLIGIPNLKVRREIIINTIISVILHPGLGKWSIITFRKS